VKREGPLVFFSAFKFINFMNENRVFARLLHGVVNMAKFRWCNQFIRSSNNYCAPRKTPVLKVWNKKQVEEKIGLPCRLKYSKQNGPSRFKLHWFEYGRSDRWIEAPGPHYFLRGLGYKEPHCFTAFLFFLYKVHHLQNFAEWLTLPIRQASFHLNLVI